MCAHEMMNTCVCVMSIVIKYNLPELLYSKTFPIIIVMIIVVIFKHLSLKAVSALQHHEGGEGTG